MHFCQPRNTHFRQIRQVAQNTLTFFYQNAKVLFVPYEDCVYPGEDHAPADLYPDELRLNDEVYPIYYAHNPGEADDGVTIGVHIDQLPDFPDWLPDWGVQAHLADRAEIAEKGYSLTPGAYVGVAPVSDDGVDFAARMAEIHSELLTLQAESNELMETISKNMKEMGL